MRPSDSRDLANSRRPSTGLVRAEIVPFAKADAAS